MSSFCGSSNDKNISELSTENVIPTTLAQWAREAYRVSKEHGWHDDPDDGKPARMPIRVALLHSEVSELLEAFRKEPHAPCDKPGLVLSCAAEELADIVLRCFDFMVEFHVNVERLFADETFQSAHADEHRKVAQQCWSGWSRSDWSDMPDAICDMHMTIGAMKLYPMSESYTLFFKCVRFAIHNGIDLELAVATKHAYNQTRSHKHGGKAF
jgi:NTP pyrophosphatase (non-canonical NTP hydrolase)